MNPRTNVPKPPQPIIGAVDNVIYACREESMQALSERGCPFRLWPKCQFPFPRLQDSGNRNNEDSTPYRRRLSSTAGPPQKKGAPQEAPGGARRRAKRYHPGDGSREVFLQDRLSLNE